MKNLDNLKIKITLALILGLVGITLAQRPENVRIDTSTTTKAEQPSEAKTQSSEPTAQTEKNKPNSRVKTQRPDFRLPFPKNERYKYPENERTENRDREVSHTDGCKKDNGQIGHKPGNRQYENSRTKPQYGGTRNKKC